MSVVNITSVNIQETKSHFLAPYKFEITFECLSPLDDDLEFKLVYVGSTDNTTTDQELDSLLVGPVPVGVNKFLFEADAPKPENIPKESMFEVTVILLTCSYKDKEFVRIGYYVDNAYVDEELLQSPPEQPQLDKIFRSILADKPRVTRFPINWDDPNKEEVPPEQTGEGDMADGDATMDTGDGDHGNESEVDEEDEDLDDDEEEEEDADEKGEIDLDVTAEKDEADGEGYGAGSDEDDQMMATDEHHHQPLPPMHAANASNAMSMEVE